jgi:hypothetical protein
MGSSPGWVLQHVVAAHVMHDGRTESTTFSGATSSLQRAYGVKMGSNECGDRFSSSAWRCWSSESVVAA